MSGHVHDLSISQEMKERKPYEKSAVVFEKKLEAIAADCGTGLNNPYLGADN